MSPNQRRVKGRKASRQSRTTPTTFDTVPVTLLVERPAHGGACVGFHEGSPYFVKHAIPGETVVAQPYAAKGKVVFAEAIDIIDASPDRIPSIWPDAGPGGVGGGELCHVRPAAQKLWKSEVVRDTVRRIGGTELADAFAVLLGECGDSTIVTQAVRTEAWRTRCEFVIAANGLPAMFVSDSNELREVSAFPLVTTDLQALDFWSEQSPWLKLWRPGDRVRAIDCVEGVFVRIGKIWYTSDGERASLNQVHYRVGDKLFAADPNGFWQAHLEAPQLLQDAVRKAVGKLDYSGALELYSGAGLLTDVLLEQSALNTLVAMEGSLEAVENARLNITDSRARNLNLAVDAKQVETKLKAMNLSGEILALADPPRSGLGKGIAEVFRKCEVPNVVLISCDPAAFSRDAALLYKNGYTAVNLQVLDIFPGTYHFEIVARFTLS